MPTTRFLPKLTATIHKRPPVKCTQALSFHKKYTRYLILKAIRSLFFSWVKVVVPYESYVALLPILYVNTLRVIAHYTPSCFAPSALFWFIVVLLLNLTVTVHFLFAFSCLASKCLVDFAICNTLDSLLFCFCCSCVVVVYCLSWTPLSASLSVHCCISVDSFLWHL